ncbi:hypothetical protein AOQ84DRAFT_223520 [Glonium stellatum]|uniref:CorA-like transporter domain-containing protein n=1 Tax=Glonium stellatum TaxID=574774 RepID=A0A8E2EXI0_9PEZI|nr:hypothetical protein AOQ84DRAFT_223520 [Glonium stellatum]
MELETLSTTDQSLRRSDQSNHNAGDALGFNIPGSYQCCVEPEEDELVDLIDIRPQNIAEQKSRALSKHTFSSVKLLQDYFSDESSETYSLRVFFICQSNSWEPLGISTKMLSEILRNHRVQEGFIEVIRSFRYRECHTEEAFCGHWFSKTSIDHDEISYIFKYPERRYKTESEAWSIRQTAVYQAIDHQSKRSCWILLHPEYESKASECLKVALSVDERAAELIAQPLQQHIMLISTYLSNWRGYMEHHEEELLSISKDLMGIRFDAPLQATADTLTRVRFIESRLLPLPPIFHSYRETFRGLLNFNEMLYTQRSLGSDPKSETVCAIENLNHQTGAYALQADFLLTKAASIAQLLSDKLALKDQHTAREQNKSICAMTRVSVKDSSTVRVITVVTLMYLPTTFVCALFGTQLLYLTPTHSLAASPQLWVLFAVSVPLTILTMFYWLMRKRSFEAKRNLMNPEEKV